MYGDFINQSDTNSHLQVYADNELIRQTWDYYYEIIYWPRFNDKKKFEASDKPQLVIDTKALLLKLNDVIKTFEHNIKLTGRPSANSRFG